MSAVCSCTDEAAPSPATDHFLAPARKRVCHGTQALCKISTRLRLYDKERLLKTTAQHMRMLNWNFATQVSSLHFGHQRFQLQEQAPHRRQQHLSCAYSCKLTCPVSQDAGYVLEQQVAACQ